MPRSLAIQYDSRFSMLWSVLLLIVSIIIKDTSAIEWSLLLKWLTIGRFFLRFFISTVPIPRVVFFFFSPDGIVALLVENV